ncbi:cytochrome c oxidase accessory protein CcoG [Gemmatimonas groenlandica]|uniref:cytochrome c oxidase accessory protein CcoG n=1 Tax=Gemmatimonas groenlandica TaxID=2732249 RepID=UPI00197E9F15|nr:cytochrome c oxidase accessory protein CcoG [Gemmatimonas groenlandica]
MSSAAPSGVGRPPSGRVLPTLNEDGTRRWIRPKPSHGAWWKKRQIVAYSLMAVFFAAPHLRLFGKPVFLMDLPHRQFTLMGYTFLPTDTPLFMLVMGSGVIGIFLITALFGRAWCGWACPQTVYLEFLFRPIGRWFDGGYTGSRNLDKKGSWFTPRRIAKYLTFFAMALFVSHTLLAFFVGTDQLYDWMSNPPSEHPTAFFFVVLFTGLVWFNFTYFREQTCLIVCPYGRWQAALIDRQSVIVAYDDVRGEPREHAGKTRDPQAGDCIDCGACVQTCPTGIDIRQGLQMECVHCTQCIDACDDIMTKVGKPTGLIRYSSQDAIAGKPRHLLRMRTILYPVVLAILIGGLITALFLKESADLTVLRGGLDGPFTEEADGRVSNQIRIKITNRRSEAMPYTVTLDGIAEAGIRPDEITVVAPENPLKVDAGTTRSTSLFVLLPRRAFTNGERMITISVTDGRRYQESVQYRLLGPVGNAPTGKFR